MLALLLVVQVLLSQRDTLAADARWRPVVATACAVAGCELPAWHEPRAWEMLARDVSAPGPDGMLEVTAAFRNQARWPQEHPVLVLELTDRHGRIVAAGAFTPSQYLGEPPDGASPATLAPGQSARARVLVREPGPEIVAFSFSFR